MSDAATRALERRWRETGATEDEARWLLARVRAGELRRDALRLAAWSGHPGACAALGERPERDPLDVLVLAGWLASIGDFGASAKVVAAVAAAEVALDRTWLDRDDRAREALASARAWLAQPSIDRALACVRAADLVPFGTSSQKDQLARLAVRAAALATLDPTRADEAVRQAVAAAGDESRVRAKVEAALAAWALGERQG